jgi:hypothetical protein
LLDDVSQFVTQKAHPSARPRFESASLERYVVSDGEGASVQVMCGARGLRARVEPHRTEVVAEARFEEPSLGCRERSSTTSEGGNVIGDVPRWSEHLVWAFAGAPAWRHRTRHVRSDNAAGHRVGITFERIIASAHLEQRLWRDERSK